MERWCQYLPSTVSSAKQDRQRLVPSIDHRSSSRSGLNCWTAAARSIHDKIWGLTIVHVAVRVCQSVQRRPLRRGVMGFGSGCEDREWCLTDELNLRCVPVNPLERARHGQCPRKRFKRNTSEASLSCSTEAECRGHELVPPSKIERNFLQCKQASKEAQLLLWSSAG